MGRLKTIKPRIQQVQSRLATPTRVREKRINGRRLQKRRLAVWSRDPHCAQCRELTSYPSGFHLDHIVALGNGGQDTDENSQVMCIPCHRKKSKEDLQLFHGHRFHGGMGSN
ncbi:MAG: HNH endonuclease [Proteobacteria bacterium]|nr:HNH endonuclease [Pseudomonadota bacterium]